MLIELTKEQQDFKDKASDFAREFVKPYAREHDKTEKINPSVISNMKAQGYMGSMISKEYGGLGLDKISIGLLNEEIGKACSSLRGLLTVSGMVALAIEKWGTEEQRNKWLPKLANGSVIGGFGLTEPNVGSDAKSIETEAVLLNDNYLITGRKKWITMGQIADVFLIFAKVEGKPTAFIVEKDYPGFTVDPMSGLIGAKGSMLAELIFENCIVPKDNIIASPGLGLTHVALPCLDYGRYTIAWGCVGLSQACLEDSIDYASKRKQFKKPLRGHQLIQKMITNMVVNIDAARLLCLQAGYLGEIGDPDSIIKTWYAKYFAADIVNEIANDAMQIHGANGCHTDHNIERYVRDAKINQIIEGTAQMHEVLIATNACRMF